MSTSASPLASHPSPDPPAFASWLQKRGVVQHPSIQLKFATDGSGYGVWSTEDIVRGEILCAIPRQSILSAQTASLNKPYEPESAADIILHLTACLLHELRIGEESEWYGWLQMIPRETVPLPTLWSEEVVGGEDGRRALDWLKGSEAQKQLERKDGEGLSLQALRQYHSTLALPPTSQCPDQSSFSTFLYAYFMVSSRGFALDSYHLIGLIPFCDMFNHSSTAPHTSLSIDANVCEHCGSLLQCPHDDPGSERLENLSAEYLARLEEDGMANMVDMRVQRNVMKNEQVFSCYDEEHADAELLVEYGFIEGANTAITWSYRDFLGKSPTAAQRFMALLEHQSEPAENSKQCIKEDNFENEVGEYSQEDTKRLFGPSCPPDKQPEPLVLRPNGELSRNLITILYNEINLDDQDDVEKRSVDLDRMLRSLQYRRKQDESPLDLDVVNEVCMLIEQRLATLYNAHMTLDDLKELVTNLPGCDHPLERVAARYLSYERQHLEDCHGRWTSIARSRSSLKS